MKTLVVTAVALTLSASAASAQGRHYDWRTGNSYSTYSDSQGTTLHGFNSRTGSQWRIRQNNDGSYNGWDANGNYFSGDHRSGSYYNLGTGTVCVGKGYARVCN